VGNERSKTWKVNRHINSPCGGSQYVTSHRDELSLAIPSRVGTVSTSHSAVTPCGRGVKAVWSVNVNVNAQYLSTRNKVCVWVAGETV